MCTARHYQLMSNDWSQLCILHLSANRAIRSRQKKELELIEHPFLYCYFATNVVSVDTKAGKYLTIPFGYQSQFVGRL